MDVKTCHTRPEATGTSFFHPLDPLSAAELIRAAQLIRDHFDWGDDLRVETIDLDEPPKDVVRTYTEGEPIQRVARFNVYRRGVMGVVSGKFDLGTGALLWQVFREDARAMVAVEEVLQIEETVKADPRFQEALRRRGLLDELDVMCIDPWTVGDFGHVDRAGPPRAQLLRLDAHLPARQLLRPSGRGAARPDRRQHA